MTRIRLILLGSFIVVFAAGISTGLLLPHLKGPPRPRSPLSRMLKLTPKQEKQMQEIWGEPGRGPGDKGPSITGEREQEVKQLLTEEQRPKYEAILQKYKARREEIAQERRRAFEEKIARTKEIFTAEQLAAYEKWLKEQREGRKGGPPGQPGRRPDRPEHQGRPAGAPQGSPDNDQSRTPHSGE